jgi:hypothetical protein
VIELLDFEQKYLVAAKISGKLNEQDIKKIHPLIHDILECGRKVNFYFEVDEFEGYTIKGLWRDLKIDSAHMSEYGKMAFVGDKKWHEWAVKATDFFTTSDVRFFEIDQQNEALSWLKTS